MESGEADIVLIAQQVGGVEGGEWMEEGGASRRRGFGLSLCWGREGGMRMGNVEQRGMANRPLLDNTPPSSLPLFVPAN